jgi:hypothetical protein
MIQPIVKILIPVDISEASPLSVGSELAAKALTNRHAIQLVHNITTAAMETVPLLIQCGHSNLAPWQKIREAAADTLHLVAEQKDDRASAAKHGILAHCVAKSCRRCEIKQQMYPIANSRIVWQDSETNRRHDTCDAKFLVRGGGKCTHEETGTDQANDTHQEHGCDWKCFASSLIRLR